MIEGVVYTLLEPLVDGRVYAGNMLQDPDLPQLPAITYEITSRNNEATACGTDDVSTDDVAVEVQFVAKTNGAAIALRDAGIAAMMAHAPPPVRGYGYSVKDEVLKTHVQVFEFIFYQSSAAP